ncbi:MAG: hypothetical protein QXZ20_00595 [Candidatus Aenigmatarchaeota archaeon]
MRKDLTFLFLLIIINLVKLSIAFEIEVLDDKITLSVGELKEIFINIRSEIDDRIIVYPKGLTTWMTIEDIGPIKANENKTIKLVLSPFLDSSPGIYKLTLLFSSFRTGETKEKTFFITLLKEIDIKIKDISISGEFKPAGNLEINIDIFNPGIRDIRNILVHSRIISTEMNVIDEFYDFIDIKIEETKRIVKRIKLKEDLKPGRYYLEVVLLRERNIIERKLKEFFIEAQPKIEKTIETKNFLFGKRITINIKNVGNAIAYNESFSINLHPISILSYKHLYGPKPEFHNNTAIWKFSAIKVGEEIIIEYEVDYTYVLIFIILILLAFFFYLYKIRNVVIRKIVLKKKDNTIDIAIEVKNNTGKDVDKVIIIDRIPILFKIKQVLGPKPLIKTSEKYYELKWKLGKLKKGEERIISYKVQEIIKVEGELSLPGAEVAYSISNKTFKNKSGNINVRF